MEIKEYSDLANKKWNEWIKDKGIYMFAVRHDLMEFIDHGQAEAAIFLDPSKSDTIKPSGNPEGWPGEFRNSPSIQSLFKSPLSDLTSFEFGCGGGRLLVPFSKQFKFSYGYDISDEAVSIANDLYQFQKEDRIIDNVLCYSGDSIWEGNNVQPNSIDFVFSYIVFQHISNEETVIKSIKDLVNLLKSDGIGRIHVRISDANFLQEDSCFHGIGKPIEWYIDVLQDSPHNKELVTILDVSSDGNPDVRRNGKEEAVFITFRKN